MARQQFDREFKAQVVRLCEIKYQTSVQRLCNEKASNWVAIARLRNQYAAKVEHQDGRSDLVVVPDS